MKILKMKNVFCVLGFLLLVNVVKSQSESFDTYNNTSTSNYDCVWCGYSDNDYETGVKLGIGYGVFKEINPILDISINLNFNFWKTEVFQYQEIPGSRVNEFYHRNFLFAISIGERINIVNKNDFKFYTGVNLNPQIYLNSIHKLIGLGIEPNIGISKKLGSKYEFFTQIGYEQHLISYNRLYRRHPNKLSLLLGINYELGNNAK